MSYRSTHALNTLIIGLGLMISPLVVATEYAFRDLGVDQTPRALTESGAILVNGTHVLIDGLNIKVPSGSKIYGLQDVESSDGPPSTLTLVGSQTNEFDVEQAYQWPLAKRGEKSPTQTDWIAQSLPISLRRPSHAIDLNSQQIVLGQVEDSAGHTQLFDVSANGNFNAPTLGTNFDIVASEARDINNQGDITAMIIDSHGLRQSYVYRRATGQGSILRNTLAATELQTEALAINDATQIVGKAQITENNWHAYLATDDILKDLGTFGGDNSVANSINNTGQVVGQAQDDTGQYHAFLYTSNRLHNLNDFVDIEGRLTNAIAINDHGTIIGTFTDTNDQVHGYLLTPYKLLDRQPDKLFCSKVRPTPCPHHFSATVLALDTDWLALAQGTDQPIVLLKRPIGRTGWSYHSQIPPETASSGFGNSLALDDQRLVIGASLDDSIVTDGGAIYVYDYNQGTDIWELVQKITSEQTTQDLLFGRSVAVHDHYIGVGHRISGRQSGFFFSQQADGSWLEFNLTLPNEIPMNFGHPVQLDTAWLVFGSGNNGAIIYQHNENTVAFDSAINAISGNEIELSNNTLAIEHGQNSFKFPVSIFEHINQQWQYQTRLISPVNDNKFGNEFALHDNTLVIASKFEQEYFINVYGRRNDLWRLRARHPVPFNPRVMALHQGSLVISPGDSTTPIQTYFLAPPNRADLQLTVTSSQTEIVVNDNIDFTITVSNQTTQLAPQSPLNIRFDSPVDYQLDSCALPQAPCRKANHSTDVEREKMEYIIDPISQDQSIEFNLTLNIPVAGSYPIVFDLGLEDINSQSEANQQTITVNVQTPSLTIQTPVHNQCYTLSENEGLPITWGVNHWPLVDDTQQTHLDWFLYQDDTLMQWDHAGTTSATTTPLATGEYQLVVKLIDQDHVATDYQDTANFCVERSPDEAPQLTIHAPSAGTTLVLPGDSIQLDLTLKNWSLSEGGQFYRWHWDQTHRSDEYTNLSLDLTTLLPEDALTEGAHQIQIDLIDSDGSVKLSREVSFFIYRPKDVTLHWQSLPNEVAIDQPFDANLSVFNNDAQTPADASLTFTLNNLNATTVPTACTATDTVNQWICQFTAISNSNPVFLNWTLMAASTPQASILANIQQNQDPDTSNNQVEVTIASLDPMDLSLTSEWQPVSVYVGQSLAAKVIVTNHQTDKTAHAITVAGSLPAQLQPESIPDNCLLETETTQWQCTLSDLAPNTSADLHWTFIAQSAGELDLSLRVNNPQNETNPGNNQISQSLSLLQPHIAGLDQFVNTTTHLSGPEILQLPVQIENWLDRPDQHLLWILDKNQENRLPLTQAEATLSLPGLSADQHTLSLQLAQGANSHPLTAPKNLTFTIIREALENIPASDCLSPSLHTQPLILIKWCDPIQDKLVIRTEEAPLQLTPQLHISNWFDQHDKTAFRWWLDGEDQGLRDNLEPLPLTLGDGSHHLKASLVYADGSPSDHSDEIYFQVVHPSLLIVQPQPDTKLFIDQPLPGQSRLSKIILKYQIHDWFRVNHGVLHTIQINDHPPIKRSQVDALDISDQLAFKDDNRVVITLIDAEDNPVGISETLTFAVAENQIVSGNTTETTVKNSGALSAYLTMAWILYGLLLYRRKPY